ncbi:hypothetical protein [Winogradskyella sp. SYSU M77433]|uniref:hypothetical protein n=1 Tax=Winogradskyella sp. SYSU M77433 TaxID=3042722 RepID=UPI0024809C08|nr:hypothetical protein [Winogradskyella sp. SYSU M77433]MDH7913362.1 hypothetical protein [Winogradskyella sp. SYSU M77433]
MTNQKLKKTANRFYPIAINGFRSVLNPLISIVFSYLIVNYFSKALWGNFVEYMLFFFLASIVTSWGSKNYLLRLFSQNPRNIVADWQQLVLARLVLCTIFIVSILILFPLHLSLYLILWLLGLFLYDSFLSIIYYNRDYIISISIEVISFLVLIIMLFIFRKNLDISILIRSYAISVVIKAVMSIIIYKKFLRFKEFKFDFSLLKLSLPFFLLAISGFMQSKIDIYAYSIFYSGKLLGEYQIISGFFIFSQSVVMLLLFPYVKNIYRMPSKNLRKIKKNVATFGLLANSFIVGSIYYALLFFDIQLSFFQLVLGFIIGYPCYVYSIDILVCFKMFLEKKVITISVICLIINFGLSLLLLYLDYNVTGVLAANAIAQIFALFFYLRLRKQKLIKTA